MTAQRKQLIHAPRKKLMDGVELVDPSAEAYVTSRIAKLLAQKKGILLDISFGGKPQPRSVTLGLNGDIKHNPLMIPFPLPTASVHTAVITHVLEFLPPQTFFKWFDELWRVVQPMGTVYVSGPYGGDDSLGWLSDPTHRTRIIEQCFAWLDPRTPLYALHPNLGRRTPKPWWPLTLARVPGTEGSISYNCVLQKRVKP